ncbi:MAG: DNA double-strand break repair nuclease NurA [Candidatus Helarchaeota archaeon]
MDNVDFYTKAKHEAHKAIKVYKEILNNISKINLKVNPLPQKFKESKIAALDGSEGFANLFGSSIIISRAAGAIFEKGRKIEPIEIMDYFITALARDINRFSNLCRDIQEFKIAHELIKKNPEILVLDGSLIGYFKRGVPMSILHSLNEKNVPHLPIKEYIEKYTEYMKLLDGLLRKCREKNILLIGVSKDSRVKYLVNHFKIKNIITDYSLLKYKMQNTTGYIGPIEPDNTPLKPVAKFLENNKICEADLTDFKLIYVKLEKFSDPIRVDFTSWQESRLDEIISFLETYHDGNGFILTAHLVHNWAVLKDAIKINIIDMIKKEILESDVDIYNSIFTPQRRDSI